MPPSPRRKHYPHTSLAPTMSAQPERYPLSTRGMHHTARARVTHETSACNGRSDTLPRPGLSLRESVWCRSRLDVLCIDAFREFPRPPSPESMVPPLHACHFGHLSTVPCLGSGISPCRVCYAISHARRGGVGASRYACLLSLAIIYQELNPILSRFPKTLSSIASYTASYTCILWCVWTC